MLLAAFLAVVAVLAVTLPYLTGPRVQYQFSAPDPWAETCFGDEGVTQNVMGLDNSSNPAPQVNGSEGSYASYDCEWEWDPAADGLTGQRLLIMIAVFEDSEPKGYDYLFDQTPAQRDWVLEADTLDGFEHGVCIDHSLLASPYSECLASDSNLKITVQLRPLTAQGEYPSTEFGPEAVPIKNLTVELGALVRETFKK
ncbi:hypothetical protein [Glycomyces artemisiae]|uniref:Uncharacterized protein n=1 Tax=Glycomyces artemisiae TaxID=1076443 RepID=A0A2T0USR5_9ACTN|nr:hypothetical protein [Glycomyces artemisiae]PRY60971.1 hypothetical protein B0I28_102586 [Glycomyces artemisiae]